VASACKLSALIGLELLPAVHSGPIGITDGEVLPIRKFIQSSTAPSVRRFYLFFLTRRGPRPKL
jgi:hypothetical protein